MPHILANRIITLFPVHELIRPNWFNIQKNPLKTNVLHKCNQILLETCFNYILVLSKFQKKWSRSYCNPQKRNSIILDTCLTCLKLKVNTWSLTFSLINRQHLTNSDKSATKIPHGPRKINR